MNCPYCNKPIYGYVPGWSIAALILLAVALLLALPMKAQSRAADEIVLPVAAHTSNGVATFVSRTTVSNLSSNTLVISVLYCPTNQQTSSDPHYPVTREIAGALVLKPGERYEIPDAVMQGWFGANYYGTVVFAAFKADGPRTHESCENNAEESITVDSTIVTSVNIGTPQERRFLQSITGVPWWAYVSSDNAAAGLDKVMIAGVREDDVWHTAIGLWNHHNSGARILVSLYAGNGELLDIAPVSLGPLGSYRQSLSVLFAETLRVSRLNRRAMPASLYLVVEQTDRMAASPECRPRPGFLAWATLADSRSGDATALPPSFLVADRSRTGEQVAAVRIAARIAPHAERITDLFHFTFSGPQCSIEQVRLGDYVLRLPIGNGKYGPPATHFGVERLAEAREMCGTRQVGSAQ